MIFKKYGYANILVMASVVLGLLNLTSCGTSQNDGTVLEGKVVEESLKSNGEEDIIEEEVADAEETEDGRSAKKIKFSYNKATRTLTVNGNNGSIKNYDYGKAPWAKYLKRDGAQTIIVKNVRRIGDKAFSAGYPQYETPVEDYCSVGNVILEEGLEEVGECAFFCAGWGYGSSAIKRKLEIPKSVKLIKKSAFQYTTFEEVKFDSNPELVIEVLAFYDCSFLKKIELPDGTKSVGDYAFSGNYDTLEEVIVPRTTEIGKRSFPSKTKVIYK